jgi:hypothetical protein
MIRRKSTGRGTVWLVVFLASVLAAAGTQKKQDRVWWEEQTENS